MLNLEQIFISLKGLVVFLSVGLLLLYLYLWNKSKTTCCGQSQFIAMPTVNMDSIDLLYPIHFCWNSELPITNKNTVHYLDSLVSILDSTKEMIITAYALNREVEDQANFYLADARATRIKSLFIQRDSSLQILAVSELKAEAEFLIDSCFKGYDIEIRSSKNVLDLGTKIIVFHEYNSTLLVKDGALAEMLDSLAIKIKTSDLRIKISGYTDNDGTEKEKYELSKESALSIKKYLLSKGVHSRRIITEYLSDSDPIESNDTEEGRRKNRRIEIQFLK